MGLLKNLKRSRKKTKLMIKMIKVTDIEYYNSETKEFNNDLPSKEKIEEVYKEFYDFIYDDFILGEILKEYNVTYDDFKFYMTYMIQNGFSWHNGRYIPVDVFSFGRELKYFLFAINNNKKMEEIYYNLINQKF